MYLEDVHDILGLEIEGTDADEYIQQIKISEEKTVQTPLYQRLADANNKLGLKRLEDMIRDKKKIQMKTLEEHLFCSQLVSF